MPQKDPRNEQSVGRILSGRARAIPDAPFILSDRRTLNYGEADLESNRLANGASALGITRESAVLVMMPNVVEFIVIWLGLGKLGAVQVPVNTAYRGSLLVHVINDSASSTMIVAAEYLERIAEVAPGLDHLERLIVFGTKGGSPELPGALARLERFDFGVLLDADDAPSRTFPAIMTSRP